MAWTFGLCDLDGVAIGQIHRAYDRRLNLVLNGLPTASVRLRLDDPLVEEITSRDGDVLLKVYQDSTLRFIGDLTTLEEVSRAEENKPPSVVCNFAGPLWRLSKRVNKIEGLTPIDERAQIAWNLIETTNTERDTGIREGTIGATASVTAGPWAYGKPLAEAITEMAAVEVYPFEPTKVAQDDFGFEGNLAGRNAPLGGTWSGTGDADDFIGTGTVSDIAVGRATANDTAARIDYLSYDYGSISAEVAVRTTSPSTGASLGMVLRYDVSTGNHVLAYLAPFEGRVKIEKKVGASQTLLAQSTPGTVLSGSFYTIRVQIEESGAWKVWFVPTGTADIGTPVLSGTDADLSSTGPLATGRIGLRDHNPTTTAHERTYDAFVATPAFYRRDDFGFSGVLINRSLHTGQTWGGAGSGGDFGGQGTTTSLGIERSNPSDADENTGRYAPASTSITGPVYAQAAVSISAGPYEGKLGVFARYTSTSNWIMATMDPGGTDSLTYSHISVRKRVGGTVTTLATSGPVAMTTAMYDIRLGIDEDGNYAVWFWPEGVSDPAAPILTGTDSDLAVGSGSAIESGQVGLYDVNYSATTVTRAFDAFRAGEITTVLQRQTLNFELNPLDLGVGGETDVAEFNASERIGTDKNVLFEYGGTHSIRSYRRVISREGLLNQAISLPEGYPESLDIRVKSDGESMNNRGLFEEVISSDVGDASLREALAAAHVAIRKDPREIVEFEPSALAPSFGDDYIVGDVVYGRAMAQGSARFNGLFRVYEVEVQVDENAKETITLRLVPNT